MITPKQKSVLLAKAMGWKESPHNRYLYMPENMHLAWRVLNWASKYKALPRDDTSLWFWWHDRNLFMRNPADAQRLWLDKIFELAVEAGIIKLQE